MTFSPHDSRDPDSDIPDAHGIPLALQNSMRVLILSSITSGSGYTCDVWRNVGSLLDPIRKPSPRGPRTLSGRPREKLRSVRRGAHIRDPLPVPRAPSAHGPGKGIFARFAFLWAFLIVFLSLATDVWATGSGFASALEREHATRAFILPNFVLFAVLSGGILAVQRRKVLETTLPALQGPSGTTGFSG